MKGFIDDIEDRTEHNTDFRRVVYTGPNLQLVLMSIAPGGDIGEEVHAKVDQFFRIEEGNGEAWINGQKTVIKADFGILVPAGTRHNIRNTGTKPMKLYTLYGPPQHADGTVEATKADAMAAEEHFAGQTTEG